MCYQLQVKYHTLRIFIVVYPDFSIKLSLISGHAYVNFFLCFVVKDSLLKSAHALCTHPVYFTLRYQYSFAYA
jgi:hypothetical protein